METANKSEMGSRERLISIDLDIRQSCTKKTNGEGVATTRESASIHATICYAGCGSTT